MIAQFSDAGARLDLSPTEYGFIHLMLSYVLHGVRLPDNDFSNLLGMSRDQAERFLSDLHAAEASARADGSHWAATGE